MPTSMTETTDRMATQYPRAAAIVHETEAMANAVLAAPMRYMVQHHGEAFWTEAERLVGLVEALGGSPLDALLEYTVAYLREQNKFMKTASYSNRSFDEARQKVYDNEAVMNGFYLSGLLLTHAFWPIHFDIHAFFRDEFVSRVPDEGRGGEVGYGHGLYLLDVLTARPQTMTTSYDISRYAQAYARRLLQQGGVAAGRCDLQLGDIRTGLPVNDQSYDWMIFAEVLEHIPDPAAALREVARCLKPGRPLFATTVIDSNALDHLYQFESVDHVRRMLHDTGFAIVTDHAFRVADYDRNAKDPTVDVALVCTPRTS